MRINRNMLLKIARDTVDKLVVEDRTVMAIYLQGSLLSEAPLIGNTADIDLFVVHSDTVKVEREIIRLSDEVHLDVAHHSHQIYRQPHELRVNPWLGPTIYGCKIMYDPQHFIDFVQASVRGQFNNPENVIMRVQRQVGHAREMWEAFYDHPHIPEPEDACVYLRALEHLADAIAGLTGPNLTERRFLMELRQRAEAVGKPGLHAGFMGLLGASSADAAVMLSWLPEWKKAYIAQAKDTQPRPRYHPYRLLYYERAIEALLASQSPHDALWPLWHTWTDILCKLSGETPHRAAWQKAGEQLGVLGEAFNQKIEALDAYIDLVEELLEAWARENGV